MKHIVSSLLFCAVTVFGMTSFVNAQHTDPSRDLAVAAIDNAIQSLKSQPNQFHLEVNVTGLKVTHSGSGGTGMVVNVTGGGTGSSVTGMNITTTGNEIEIARQKTTEALLQESAKAIKALEELKATVSVAKPEENKVKSALTKVYDTYIAPIGVDVLKGVIFKWLKIKG